MVDKNVEEKTKKKEDTKNKKDDSFNSNNTNGNDDMELLTLIPVVEANDGLL